MTSWPSSGKSLAITLFPESRSRYLASKNFSRITPLGVDEEISGTRHAVELSRGLGVQNLVGANDLGIGIGEHGEIDLAAIREVFQYGFAVVADRRELDSLLLESCFGILQLDQLPFAVGSPIRGTEKEQDRAVRSFQAFQCLLLAELVAKRKRQALSARREAQSR